MFEFKRVSAMKYQVHDNVLHIDGRKLDLPGPKGVNLDVYTSGGRVFVLRSSYSYTLFDTYNRDGGRTNQEFRGVEHTQLQPLTPLEALEKILGLGE